jgi:hypothetical protein
VVVPAPLAKALTATALKAAVTLDTPLACTFTLPVTLTCAPVPAEDVPATGPMKASVTLLSEAVSPTPAPAARPMPIAVVGAVSVLLVVAPTSMLPAVTAAPSST